MKKDFFNMDFNISDEKIKEMAKKEGKDFREMKEDIKSAVNDLKYTKSEIRNIIEENNYKFFPDNSVHIDDYGKNGEFENSYLCHDHGEYLSSYKKDDIALVTGFGPTNSPTAGTLSIIFKLLNLQRDAKIYSHVIISDLGALNSRKKPLNLLLDNTDRFIEFISKLGFDYSNGEIRTHNNYDHLRTFAICSSQLDLQDFLVNKEFTDDLYKKLKVQGNDFSLMVDQTFTVADIMLPIIRDKKRMVLVSAGLEEHYYPRLSRLIIDRIKSGSGGINNLISDDVKISAIYGQFISGLFPYVKMSKSIPSSAINIGDTEENIKDKILNCEAVNEEVIFQMINLASNWDFKKLKAVKEAFALRKENKKAWEMYKKEYLEFFISIKKIWDETKPKKYIDVKDRIYYNE